MINHWKEFKVPLGLVASGLVFALAGWGWMNSTYVLASDFRGYQVQMEQRLLTQQKAQLETEVLKLEVKKEAYPDRFDAIDKALLERQREQLQETKRELQLIRQRK